MIHVISPLPRTFAVACSGGTDSMAIVDFLRQGRHKFTVLHFHHNTPQANEFLLCVQKYCNTHSIPLRVGRLTKNIPSNTSKEAFWRDQRYAFFESTGFDNIITCHHLNDVFEWWLFTTLRNGKPSFIPYRRGKYFRPFLTTYKKDLMSWLNDKEVPHCIDLSNQDTVYRRNYIREIIIPNSNQINPGLIKNVRSQLIAHIKTQREQP